MKRYKEWLTKYQLWLSGVVPLLIFLGYFLFIRKIYPFGQETILTVDSGQQYVRFLIWARDSLFKNHDVFYTLYKGYGGEMYSTWAYYLISPFNIFLFFLSNKFMPLGIAIVTTLKIAAGAVAMNWYLLKSKFLDLENITFSFVFAIGYALSSWTLSNQLNFIWLDILWLLPLFMLSIEKLMDSKNKVYIPFVIIVATMLIINYYMAYIAGLFSLVYVFLYLWVEKKEFRLYFKYVLNGLLSVLISAFLTIPTLYQLISGKMQTSGDRTIFNSFEDTMSGGEFFNQLARFNLGFGGLKDLSANQAQLYCGMLISILAFIYLITGKESAKQVRKRFAFMVMFFILVVAAVWVPANIIWHAGAFPTWYNDRFMFLWAFLAVSCATLTWDKIKTLTWSNIVFSALLIALCCLAGFKILGKPKITLNKSDIIISIVFIIINVVLLLLLRYSPNSKHKFFVQNILALIFISEIGLNTYLTNQKFSYMKEYQIYNPIVYFSKYKSKLNLNSEHNFDRVGRTNTATFNDALNNRLPDGYSFNSNTDFYTRNWRNAIGGMGDNNIVSQNASNIVNDNLVGYQYYLALKANTTTQKNELIGTNNSLSRRMVYNPLWSKELPISNDPDNTAVFKLKHALPLGFIASNSVLQTKITNSWSYNLSEFMNQLNGTKDEHFILEHPFNVKLRNLIKKTDADNNRIYEIKDKLKPATISIKMKVPTNDTYYLMIPANNAEYSYQLENHSYRYNLSSYVYKNNLCTEVASDDKGKIVNVTLTQNSKVENWSTLGLYHFQDKEIAKIFDKLKQQPLRLTTINNSQLIGDVTAKKSGTLMVTIPAVRGWTAKVDGQEVPVKLALGTWIGINVNKGYHKIELQYHVPYLIISTIISCIASVIVMYIGIFQWKRKDN